MPDPVVVNRELLNWLRKLRERKNSAASLIAQLTRKFATHADSRETLLLFGHFRHIFPAFVTGKTERMVGKITGIAPGIVLLHNDSDAYHESLCGLLIRSADPESTISLEPLDNSETVFLHITESPFIEDGISHFPGDPARIHLGVAASSTNGNKERLGIGTIRWFDLEEFFRKWLPLP